MLSIAAKSGVRSFFLFGILLCVLHAGLARASELSISVPIVDSAPRVDGSLDDPIWQKATKVVLPFDYFNHAKSAEKTTAYILSTQDALYVAFAAEQTRTAIRALQRTNNVGAGTDDEVRVDLWPSGTGGFSYEFVSTPAGIRYQTSSENLTYDPVWDARGHVNGSEYILTMRIPFRVMRRADHSKWLVQLSRFEAGTGSLYIANDNPSSAGSSDVNYAIPITGFTQIHSVAHRPRLGVYGLASAAAPAAGGSTSRLGLDAAIPISRDASFIATIHPDYSNVERDQQTISPSVFRRFLSETRPFFAQGSRAYNVIDCFGCAFENILYTPSIPTPRSGFALEGKHGPLTFAGFDAVGSSRNDQAQSLTYTSRPQTLKISGQHVGVSMPLFSDNTTQLSALWSDLKHSTLYADYGVETGTGVSDPSAGRFREIGGAIFGPNTLTGFGVRNIGSQYNPYDGFFSNSGIAGYGLTTQHRWRPRGGKVKSILAAFGTDRYMGRSGFALGEDTLLVDIVTRSLWEFTAYAGSRYLLQSFHLSGRPTYTLVIPVIQNTTSITYGAGTATPSTLSYAHGDYGGGTLISWKRVATVRLNRRTTLTAEADDTRQYFGAPQAFLNTSAPMATANIQWLERASLVFQQDANTSVAFGVRRLTGLAPSPNSGGTCAGVCTNISFAYYRRFHDGELYLAYGNPSKLMTSPQALVKWIYYLGSDKGT